MDWDPASLTPSTTRSTTCLNRTRKDLSALQRERPPGIYVASDETDMTLVHALIVGPEETPYEKGFFYFILRVPPDYPIQPPRVKFMTTGGSSVRFNPNLYTCGKVCLSILGTWPGPAWSPAHTLSSVLISIQSLLNEKPYHNEPGFEIERKTGEVEMYNEVVQHETLRVAVVGMVDNDYGISMPDSLVAVMHTSFLQYYDFYVNLARNRDKLTNKVMMDPFSANRGSYKYRYLLKRLEVIHGRLSTSATQ